MARALAHARVCRDDPGFFRVLDVARRIAGTGSLGLRRYSILVHGYGGRNGNVLLDLKQAAPSRLAKAVAVHQPQWTSESARVVTIQRRVQAVPVSLLHAVRMGPHSFILRELQPVEDRLALEAARNRRRRLADALRVLAEIVAWGQLRSSSRDGSATVDEWVAFGHDQTWARAVADYARYYADVVHTSWQEFAEAYDNGALTPSS